MCSLGALVCSFGRCDCAEIVLCDCNAPLIADRRPDLQCLFELIACPCILTKVPRYQPETVQCTRNAVLIIETLPGCKAFHEVALRDRMFIEIKREIAQVIDSRRSYSRVDFSFEPQGPLEGSASLP